VLRLSYIDANADTEQELVEERLKWLSKLIKERWREQRALPAGNRDAWRWVNEHDHQHDGCGRQTL
jgi:hypothetical protein